jgi:hypothetical protein
MINLNKKDPIADAVKEILQQEALKGNQGTIDKNHNNKVDAEDFKILRGEKKEKKKEVAEETVEEGIKDVAKKAFKALTGGSDKDQLDALRKRMYKPEPAKKPSDKAMGEETQLKTLRQFKENAFDWKKKQEPQPNGGSGVKQGTRYGGSKQKDKPEQDTDEKK